MSAWTRLANGTIERFHFPGLKPCHDPSCEQRHATMAELDTFEVER